MRWYMPSFHGDFRFVEEKGGKRTKLIAERPTPAELEAIRRYWKTAQKKGWTMISFEQAYQPGAGESTFFFDGAFAAVAAPMAKLLNVGKVGILTALAFESGRVKATEVVDPERLPAWMTALGAAPAEPQLAATGTDAPVAAVTVSRPKLSCPECSGRPEGARKACDVLWEFLDQDQRREWLASRRVTAFGNLTGHAYDLRPRDSAMAAQRGRIVFDMDDEVVLHNFDLTVPPEEELLQAKLILEHREHWLRISGEVDPYARAAPGTIFRSPLPPVFR